MMNNGSQLRPMNFVEASNPAWCEVDELAGGKHGIFIVGVGFAELGDNDFTNDSYYRQVVHHHFSTSVYSTTLNTWWTVASPPLIGPGSSMAGTADGKLALIAGNGSSRTYTYDIAADQWSSFDALEADGTQDPIAVTASAMTPAQNGWLYAIMDGGEFCSSGNGQPGPVLARVTLMKAQWALSMAALRWLMILKMMCSMPLLAATAAICSVTTQAARRGNYYPQTGYTPSPIQPGAGLIFMPGEDGNLLYAVEGNYMGSNRGFWRYPIPEPNKIGFENSAIVVPPGSPSANWLNLNDPLPEDVNFRVGSGSLWFNGTGRPNNGGSVPTSGADPFLDAAHHVYRMCAPGFALGYHTYTEPVTATTTTGIQAMINTGANQVIVQPGIYEEDSTWRMASK